MLCGSARNFRDVVLRPEAVELGALVGPGAGLTRSGASVGSSLSIGKIVFDYAAGPQACHPWNLFKDSQPDLFFCRNSDGRVFYGPAQTGSSSCARNRGTHSDLARPQGIQGVGRKIRRRVPAI